MLYGRPITALPLIPTACTSSYSHPSLPRRSFRLLLVGESCVSHYAAVSNEGLENLAEPWLVVERGTHHTVQDAVHVTATARVGGLQISQLLLRACQCHSRQFSISTLYNGILKWHYINVHHTLPVQTIMARELYINMLKHARSQYNTINAFIACALSAGGPNLWRGHVY